MDDKNNEPSRPPKITPKLLAAPKKRQLYWCNLWNEAQLPEFHKCRPALIISTTNSLNGHSTILPGTTVEQPGNRWAYKLTTQLNHKTTWIVCNHPQSVANSRFVLQRKIPVLTNDEMEQIFALLNKWLQK